MDYTDEPLPTPTETKTQGWSPKMIYGTIASAVVGVVLAFLNGVQSNPDLLGGLPPFLQAILIAVVPTVVTALATYSAKPGSTVEVRKSTW